MVETTEVAEIQSVMRLAREARASVDAVPSRYATGLLALADDLHAAGNDGIYDQVSDELAGLDQLVADSDQFRRLVEDPRLSRDAQMKGAMAALESAGITGTVRNFVGVVINNRRLAMLPRIIATFRWKLDQRRGLEVAEVTSAIPLSDVQRAQVAASLARAGHARVRLTETVDSAILGGLVVKIGSRLYDSSIRSRLQRLSYAMKGAA